MSGVRAAIVLGIVPIIVGILYWVLDTTFGTELDDRCRRRDDAHRIRAGPRLRHVRRRAGRDRPVTMALVSGAERGPTAR